jgi:hypothetical protein
MISAFETRSAPALARYCPRSFAFYVAHPIRSIQFSAFQVFDGGFQRLSLSAFRHFY